MRFLFILFTSSLLACAQVPVARIAAIMSQGSVNQGLLGYWKFNEGIGLTAYDSTANHNDGTLSGSPLPVWTNGISGSALLFAGLSKGYVDVPGGLTNFPSGLTIACWAKSTTDGVLISKTNAYWFGVNAGKLEFLKYTSSTLTTSISTSTVNITNWTHLAVTYNNTTSVLYLNGSSIPGTSVSSGVIDNNTNAFDIAKTQLGVDAWKGPIDEVRIYNRVLSTNEIIKLYKIGNVVSPAP